ncbi:ubiquitin-conjugating enzyme E2 J1 [Dermatophagoides farinae]|uniref:Ubiquitin-conjugating enzyme E2 J1 n=1 Tax=Dermatophagoides farinae TaxID=6954 RepID=A0A922I2M8_DERFA|nr:ubiquitin-conjugating enzyme E2 J1-like [Dermatophagoides farinae]KAH7645099.1 ubiquitin-conjugating enzyme e2 j1-like protein [Dermatophagoides farinae]KAH9520891.1 Ubiquitin-conjugating enzyme E2 J1 [Dermatophagoides farinae]
MDVNYNLRSPAVKRILLEAKEMKHPTHEYYARPLEDNIFEWHFTVRGASDSDFSGGLYHGRIILPNEYPMKPPSIIMLTPNGRFELNKKICLSISGHHPETWMPSWSIRTVLLAIISFMPTPALGHIGALDYSSEERRALAIKSCHWKCDLCGPIRHHLKSITTNQTTIESGINQSESSSISSGSVIEPTIVHAQQQNYSNWSSWSTLVVLYYSVVMLIIGLLVRRLLSHI